MGDKVGSIVEESDVGLILGEFSSVSWVGSNVASPTAVGLDVGSCVSWSFLSFSIVG